MDSSISVILVEETAYWKNWQYFYLRCPTSPGFIDSPVSVLNFSRMMIFLYIFHSLIFSMYLPFLYQVNRTYAASIWKIKSTNEELRDQIEKWMYLPPFFWLLQYCSLFLVLPHKRNIWVEEIDLLQHYTSYHYLWSLWEILKFCLFISIVFSSKFDICSSIYSVSGTSAIFFFKLKMYSSTYLVDGWGFGQKKILLPICNTAKFDRNKWSDKWLPEAFRALLLILVVSSRTIKAPFWDKHQIF